MPDVPGVINYPAALDSAVTLLQVRDLASTTLAADIDDNDTTITVASTAGWPSASVVTIGGEHITYTAKTSTTLTVGTRGAFQADGGTAPAPHASGSEVSIKVIAATHRVLVDAILAMQAKQGAGADTPNAGDFAKGTGTGLTAWEPLLDDDVLAALGYTPADDADLNAHMAASNPHSGAQPLDAELTAIAGLTGAADRVPYFTGPGAAALTALTAAGRALIDDVDAATQRATLGLGSVATQGANSVAITGGAITGITDLAIADGGTGASTAANARSNLGLAIGSDVQAYDAELAAIAALTSAANKGIQFTGAGVAGTYDLTAAGKALLDDADAAAQRATLGLGTIATQGAGAVAITGGSIAGITDLAVADGGTGASNAAGARTNLGLVIGTDIQAYDGELAAIAALTSAANKLPYFTGSNAAALADLTSAGRALLDDADAAAQRVTLGLGNVDNTSDANKPVSTAQAAADALKLNIADQTMVLLAGFPQVFTNQAAVPVDNCFSSTYRNYRIVVNIDSATATALVNMRMRAGGVNVSVGYEEFIAFGNSSAATLAGSNVTGGSSWLMGSLFNGSVEYSLMVDLFSPAVLARMTTGHFKVSTLVAGTGAISYGDGTIRIGSGVVDGFSIYPASGTITGEIRVYGIR